MESTRFILDYSESSRKERKDCKEEGRIWPLREDTWVKNGIYVLGFDLLSIKLEKLFGKKLIHLAQFSQHSGTLRRTNIV